jgi:hypothetical protein
MVRGAGNPRITVTINRRVILFAAALVFTSLPQGVQHILAAAGVNEKAFPSFLAKIEAETDERERAGESDHLVFFVLQSRVFTKLPPIEPAISAKAYITQEQVPRDAAQRMKAFLQSEPQGERMEYARSLITPRDGPTFLEAEYRRAMVSLYRKEFEQAPDFYQTRGHSTDTDVSANYAVWNALKVLHFIRPGLSIDEVLVVGPGLDYAPRTGLDERYPPQSYQPFAIADAVRGLGLGPGPQIDCLDINARVLRFFSDFKRRPHPQLHLSTTPGVPEYEAYFRQLGQSIGQVRQGKLTKTIELGPEVVSHVRAYRGNIVTREPERKYGLVVATNVLIYYNDLQLMLSLANMSAALDPGGLLIINELRPVIDRYSVLVGLAPVQARTLKVADGKTGPLFDSFAIYEKIAMPLDS